MRKKDPYTVRTSVPEAILITVVTILAFAGALYVFAAFNKNDSDKPLKQEEQNAPLKYTVTIRGDSMLPTYLEGDVVMATSDVSDISCGDIIVFEHENSETGEKTNLIKRVIATEGQTIDIDFVSWIVKVDGKPLGTDSKGNSAVEQYVFYLANENMKCAPDTLAEPVITYPYTVPEGCCFVMGDNRNNSEDSRSFGAVELNSVKAKIIDKK